MTFIAVTNYFLALLHILPSISAQMLTVFSIISNFLIQTSFGVVLEIFGFILLLAGFRALSQWANLYIESRYNAPLANKIGEKLILVKWGVVLSILRNFRKYSPNFIVYWSPSTECSAYRRILPEFRDPTRNYEYQNQSHFPSRNYSL